MAPSNRLSQTPTCPHCKSTYTIRKGKRRNRLQTVPLFQCNECSRRFTGMPGKHKTYPLKYILEAVSTYNLGNSLSETLRVLRNRFHLDVPERTVRSWLKAYRPLTTFRRLRTAGAKLFELKEIIKTQDLDHRQVYRYQVHRAKLELLLNLPSHKRFTPLKQYLNGVSGGFPHELFRTTEHRSSTFPATIHPTIETKENHATEMAKLVLPVSPSNKKRHETLQRFMLVNDSVTLAVEVPIYLTQADIDYFRRHGFTLPFDSPFITGHVDILQVRNGYLHILDYKPEAKRERHAHVQLTMYALGLSRRANLPLKYFKCAWFDEHSYYEFFPLQGVYKPRQHR